jgi:serine/threonine protein kinase/formylglycine-generating enzyme required for sulfatase activity
MDISACPDAGRYRRMLSGELSPVEAEQLASHLETCPACAESVAGIGDDTLAEALRAAATAPLDPEGACVEQIISRFREASGTDAATVSNAGATDSELPAANAPDEKMSFLAPAQAPDELGRLGHYRVLRLLGQGGMGLVFEAEDARLQRRVALKVMKPEVAARARHRERFVREAQAAARVEHEHIVPIFQIDEQNGVPFIAMPFLKGEPLDARLRRGRMAPAEVVNVGTQIAEGLAAAHAHGLIHRDIKPGNIWLEADDPRVAATRRDSGAERAAVRIRILDFGLARLTGDEAQLTQSGAIMGTPAYMAPEQARGQPVDARADLFSLGCVLYEMATGRRAFHGRDTMAVLSSLALDTPDAPAAVNPTVPAKLSSLIMRLLEKEPAKRPGSAAEVAAELRRLAIAPGTDAPATEDFVPRSAPDDVAAVEAPPHLALPSQSRGEGKIGPTAASSPSPRFGGRLGWGVIAACALFLIGGGFAAYQLVFKSKDGTLVVEVDGDADVRFKNGELQIYGDDGKLRYTLKPGERNAKVAPGTYTVKVAGADGVKLETPEFVMEKDGRVALRVTAEPLVVAVEQSNRVPGKENSAGDPGRAVPAVLPAGQPPLAAAPFDSTMAKQLQDAWAKHFGTPVEFENTAGMKFRLIPPGSFTMGSADKDQRRFMEGPPHEAVVTWPFSIGVHEVTHRQYEGVMSPGKQVPADVADLPAANLTWTDAQEFCRLLNERPEEKQAGRTYRLAADVEWEYACRAGTTGPYPFPDEQIKHCAWLQGNAGGKAHPVGTRQPNAWGLHDMIGNVGEWCQDTFHQYNAAKVEHDPTKPIPNSGKGHVVRSKHFKSPAYLARSSYRVMATEDNRTDVTGFRVVMVPGPKAAASDLKSLSAAEKPPARDAVPGELLFFETYDDPKQTADRAKFPGWSRGVEAGALVTRYKFLIAGASAPPVWFEKPAADVAFVARLRAEAASLNFYCREFEWGKRSRNLRLTVAPDGSWRLARDSYKLGTDGEAEFDVEEVLAKSEQPDPGKAAGKWVTVAVRAAGSKVEVWANGSKLAEAEDAPPPEAKPGKAALWIDARGDAREGRYDLDHVAVWRLVPEGKK